MNHLQRIEAAHELRQLREMLHQCPPCNSRCEQGRQCPANAPAEAATEIGADELEPMGRTDRIVLGVVYAASALSMLALLMWIAERAV